MNGYHIDPSLASSSFRGNSSEEWAAMISSGVNSSKGSSGVSPSLCPTTQSISAWFDDHTPRHSSLDSVPGEEEDDDLLPSPPPDRGSTQKRGPDVRGNVSSFHRQASAEPTLHFSEGERRHLNENDNDDIRREWSANVARCRPARCCDSRSASSATPSTRATSPTPRQWRSVSAHRKVAAAAAYYKSRQSLEALVESRELSSVSQPALSESGHAASSAAANLRGSAPGRPSRYSVIDASIDEHRDESPCQLCGGSFCGPCEPSRSDTVFAASYDAQALALQRIARFFAQIT